MSNRHPSLNIAILLTALFLLSTSASAFTVTWETPDPSSSSNLSDSTTLNISVTTGANVNQTKFYYNTSSGLQHIETDENSTSESDKKYWNVSFDTTQAPLDEGALLLSANATNTTGNTSSKTQEVTIDNVAPTFDIQAPQTDEANITSGQTYLNLTNITDTHSSIDEANYEFSNSSNMTASGSSSSPWTSLGSIASQEINKSVSISLKDGEYRIWFNVSDDLGNIRYKSTNITVDRTGPDAYFNSEGNEVNVTINDTAWNVRENDVVFSLENDSYWDASGNKGNNSSLTKNGEFFYKDLSLNNFEEGSYTLHIWANDTNNNLGHSRTSSFYIDNTTPTVNALNISNTSTLDSITNETVFEVNASVNDAQAIESCTLTSYLDNKLIATNETSKSTDDSGIYENETLDFTGREGNLTLTMTCSDPVGNEASNSTLTMTDGTQTESFPIDDAAPTLDTTSITPTNNSFINNTDPRISFNLTDFTGVDNSSIQVWFNDTEQNYGNYTTSLNNDNSTAHITIHPDTLQEQEYNITVNATDVRGAGTGNTSYNFTVDTTAPTIDSIETDHGTEIDGELWHDDTIIYTVQCSDESSGMATYSLEEDGTDTGDGDEKDTSQTSTDLSFDPDDDEEDTIDLDFSCTDTAGNTNTTTNQTKIDTQGPSIETRTPLLTQDPSNTPYEQTITVDVTDSGSGFSDDLEESDLDLNPTFNGNDVDSYDVTINSEDNEITVTWDQDNVGLGTHDVSLDDGGTWTVDDAVGNSLDITEWSFDVEKEQTQNEQYQLQTLSSSSLSLTDVPDSITMTPGNDRTVEVLLENDEDTTTDATIDITTSSSDIDASVDQKDLSLSGGDTYSLNIDIQTTEGFTGSENISIDVEYDDTTESGVITVIANQGTPDLAITDTQRVLELFDNSSGTITATIENIGDIAANGLQPTLTKFDFNSTPSTLSVESEESNEIELNVSPANKTIGSYNTTLRLSNEDRTVSHSLTVKIQPTTNATRQNITEELQKLESTINTIDNETEQQQLQERIEDAQTAIQNNDYAQAATISQQIKQKLETETTVKDTNNFLLILAIFGLLLPAAGVFTYVVINTSDRFSLPSDNRESTPSIEFKETNKSQEPFGERLQNTALYIAESIAYTANSLITSPENDTAPQESTEVSRKKIRFDD